MSNTIKALIAFAIIIMMGAFTPKKDMAFYGTYGVSASDPSQIKLTINADQSFHYQDFSNPDKKVAVSGNWIQKGNKLVLKNNGSTQRFHDVWIFIENGQVAKSRKGLTFYRLSKVGG